MEQAARSLERNPWADNLHRERRENARLNYLFHARNADEHGLVSGYQAQPASLSIGNMFSFAGDCRNVTISNCIEVTQMPDGSKIERRVDGSFSSSDGELTSGWLNSEVPVQRTSKHILLGSVFDRGEKYELPDLGCGPDEAARVMFKFACAWLTKKVSELEKFVG